MLDWRFRKMVPWPTFALAYFFGFMLTPVMKGSPPGLCMKTAHIGWSGPYKSVPDKEGSSQHWKQKRKKWNTEVPLIAEFMSSHFVLSLCTLFIFVSDWSAFHISKRYSRQTRTHSFLTVCNELFAELFGIRTFPSSLVSKLSIKHLGRKFAGAPLYQSSLMARWQQARLTQSLCEAF